jgi:hypothetical protein
MDQDIEIETYPLWQGDDELSFEYTHTVVVTRTDGETTATCLCDWHRSGRFWAVMLALGDHYEGAGR